MPSHRIKVEAGSEAPYLDAPDVADGDGDGDDWDSESGLGFLEDENGQTYYSDEGFRIRQIVPATVVQRSLGDLYHTSQTRYMNLNPEYQREVVWDDTRASGLIVSVMQGYFIPPIIFNVIATPETAADGRKRIAHLRVCVDGKQRMTSVIKFMEGKIGFFDNNDPPKKWFYDHPIVNGVRKQSKHDILPPSTKEFFRQRTFTCYEYANLNNQVEENMFQLVQRGMPLTPAEKLQALSTKWAAFTKQYEADYNGIVNLVKHKRASGFRIVITIFCQILEVMSPSGRGKNREGAGHTPGLKSHQNPLQKLLVDDQSLDEGVKSKLKEVFDTYQRLLELSSDRSRHSRSGLKLKPNSAFSADPDYLYERGVGRVKTFSPLELVASCILIFVHMHNRSDHMLLGDIKEMRCFLRENQKDLRLNQDCWSTAWTYIETVMLQRRGGEGTTESRVQRQPPEIVISDDEHTGSGDEASTTPIANGEGTHISSPYFHDSGETSQQAERANRADRRATGQKSSQGVVTAKPSNKRTNLAIRGSPEISATPRKRTKPTK